MQHAGLISTETMLYCANAMQEVMKVIKETKTVIGQAWKEQRNREVEKNMKIEAEKMSKKNIKSVSPSRKSKLSSRGHPNSNLTWSSLNACRSPNRSASTPLSPSRPPFPISRGRRLVNAAVNMQKSLNFESNNYSDASSQKESESEDELYFSPCTTPNPPDGSTETVVGEIFTTPRLLPAYK